MKVVISWFGSALWVTNALGCRDPSSRLQVDLGYAIYQGYYNDTFDLNIWKSVRYAAAPTGNLRWQAPVAPAPNASRVIPAVEQPPICPQTGGFGLPAVYGFTSGPGNEDCLFLNVYAAPNASDLPVLVWIHGGGYSKFGATYDPSIWMNTNNNAFITVEIQYRLGAFGFLASEDIKTNGQLNAGLLDQRFALEWVQQHIVKFGGDPRRVTIGGESSGAGSVMYHAMAYGGNADSSLFNNIIAASPYTPHIYTYNDSVPMSYYNDFALLAGCGPNSTQRNQYSNVFQCLVAADTTTLQNASGLVSTTQGYFGSFAFLPVVDGDYIQKRPSVQLSQGQVSGKRLLVGNNANEGVPLTNPNAVTRENYDSFINNTFPLFTAADISLLNLVYQINKSLPFDNDTRYDTLGGEGPTALTQSEMATGIQQTIFDIDAETIFDCPAQWMAEAFSTKSRQAWRYQYSVTPAYHGADLSAYFSVGAEVPNQDFRHTFQKIWGSFIINDTPIISIADATAGYDNSSVPAAPDGSIQWPEYSRTEPWLMDLNTTGGTLSQNVVASNLSYYQRVGPGIVNNFRIVNASSWEGGRGARCDFWLQVSARVPQ